MPCSSDSREDVDNNVTGTGDIVDFDETEVGMRRTVWAQARNEISRGTNPIGRSNRNKQCYEFKRPSLAPL